MRTIYAISTVLPVFDYAHAPDACSVIGGRVHRGPGAVDWRGPVRGR